MRNLLTSLGTATILAIAAGQLHAEESLVRSNAAGWVISGTNRSVFVNRTNLSISVKAGPVTWQTLDSGPEDITLKSGGAVFKRSLKEASHIDFEPVVSGYSDGLRIRLSGFTHEGKQIDAVVDLTVSLEQGTGEMICEASVLKHTEQVRELSWPRGFLPGSADQTVVPFMQGMLLPKDWPRKVYLYEWLSYGRGLYMPWWGQQQGQSGVLVMLETPDDGGCRFEHPAGGPTRIEPRWVHSLGDFRGVRRIRYSFFDKGNYVDMAARYRSHVLQNGTLVTLKEKIARNPIAAGLIGTPVVHTTILNHIQPESSYYKKDDPAANHQLTTFDQRAAELRHLRESGVLRAYVHLDGWGKRGYDNLHPDVLPPAAESGGWEGMRRIADTCDSQGYIFALHDQYRDFYKDAASYSDDLTVVEEDGSRPLIKIWWGGSQSTLCSKFAPGYVARNHRLLRSEGVKVRGSYLDVFSVVPGDECYNPEHAVTRADSIRYRGECFNIIRDLEGVVSSEEPADWAMRYLHLVHHAPFALDPDPGKGPGMGVPIPLHTLVYHDALVVPWGLSKGGWGIPDADSGYLHALANAGVPYASTTPDPVHLEQVRTVCALHHRLALVPMVRHEFLDKNFRRQKTTYKDGTTVEVDFESGSHVITPPLTAAELKTISEPMGLW